MAEYRKLVGTRLAETASAVGITADGIMGRKMEFQLQNTKASALV